MDKNLIAFLDSNFVSSLIGGLVAISAVFIDRYISDRKAKKSELDILKKMLIDILDQTHAQLTKIETLAEESKALSYKPLNVLRDIMYLYKAEKIRVYLIDDDDIRSGLNSFFYDIEYNFMESYQDKVSRASLELASSIDEGFLNNIKSKKSECEKLKKKIDKIKK